MSARSPLLGRRIHIAGSIAKEESVATKADTHRARQVVAGLVKALTKLGADFVIPVDADPKRADGESVTFDWTVWESLESALGTRPKEASEKFAIGVQHNKTEEQIPPERVALWDKLKANAGLAFDNASYWTMNAKRMEIAARSGDILITLGGTEGVLYLADLYHAAGKPVIPLDFPITSSSEGSRRLYALGSSRDQTSRLFRSRDGDPHSWLNRIRFPARESVVDCIAGLIDCLEALEPPHAFAVRLLNTDIPEFGAVDDYFEAVVKPIVEEELGYQLIVVDGEQPFEHARVDQEIFEKLHRSQMVLADVTASRPNCFLEMGYAFGRPIPTMVMGLKDSKLPFDITTVSGHLWSAEGSIKERKDAFRTHWNAIRNRPPLVTVRSLIA